MQGVANFFSIVPSPMILVDGRGTIALANEHTCSLLGYEPGGLIGKVVAELMPEQYRAKHTRSLEDYFRSPETGEMCRELIVRHVDGSEIPIEISLNPYSSVDAVCTLMCIHVKTGCKATESRMTHLHRVLVMQGRINALIVRVHDRDELLREACQIVVETGAFKMALIGLLDTDGAEIQIAASFGEDAEAYLQDIEIESVLQRGPMSISIREGRPLWIQCSGQSPLTAAWHERCARFGYGSAAALPLHQGGMTVGAIALYAKETIAFDDEETAQLVEMAGNLSFAIDRIEREKMLKHLTNYDALTGLANRVRFLNRVTKHLRGAITSGRKLAVAEFNLERFKNINDSLGHSAGDEILKQVAKWLTHMVGDVKHLARLDADHFAVVIPDIETEGDVALLIEQWMKMLREHPFCAREDTFRISAKAGISMYPDDGSNADTLFKHAEAALKQARASRNRYLFHTPKMTEMMAGKFMLENHLRQALERQEFVLHYQPKVNMVGGELTGAEALIRWNDPRTGLVPPARFIPMLEETGLIYEVGRWALGKTIEDYLRWRKAGLPVVRVAVNVSPLQLRDRHFIDDIEQAIGTDPETAKGLELEITESMIMEDVEYSIAVLRKIRSMGVTIAIDDFGTGFSSLSYLSKLPLDTLKIDRSFVVDLAEAQGRLAQVSAIISLAHSMHLKVVAEGVETEDQLSLLRMLGCDEMQGFLFSRPVPCEVFEARFLASQRSDYLVPAIHLRSIERKADFAHNA
jgi:diguanylate cyclase (GGDEF)-like protein/PAS domain S-box-containing protein